MSRRSVSASNRVYLCRCRRGEFTLTANESPHHQKCLRCLSEEQSDLYRTLLRRAPTRSDRRAIRRLMRVSARLTEQSVRLA
jgi:glutamyl-tRNA reductase